MIVHVKNLEGLYAPNRTLSKAYMHLIIHRTCTTLQKKEYLF